MRSCGSAPSIAVVGAGPAGLAAAWRLRAAGLPATLLERSAVPGGRAAHQVVEGFTLEPGAHVLSGADRRLRRLVEAAGLGGELAPVRPRGIGQLHAGRVVPVDPWTPLGIAAIPGLRPHQAWRLLRLPRLVARFAERLDAAAPERAARLDDRSLADFGRLYFGASVLDRWLAPSVSAEALCDERDASRLLFLLRYHTRGNARPLRLRWGIGALSRALAAQLDVRPGVRVERVVAGASGFDLELAGSAERGGASPRPLRADAVVIATPAEEAGRLTRGLLGFAERRFFDAARSIPAISVAVALERPFETRVHRVRFPHAERWPLETITWEPPGRGGRVPAGAGLALAIAGESWTRRHLRAPDDAVAKEILELLDRLYPGLRGAVRFTRVYRQPLALPRFDVGRFRAIAQLRRSEAESRRRGRRLYFAGDYLGGPWVESALASGFRTADAVIADLGA